MNVRGLVVERERALPRTLVAVGSAADGCLMMMPKAPFVLTFLSACQSRQDTSGHSRRQPHGVRTASMARTFTEACTRTTSLCPPPTNYMMHGIPQAVDGGQALHDPCVSLAMANTATCDVARSHTGYVLEALTAGLGLMSLMMDRPIFFSSIHSFWSMNWLGGCVGVLHMSK